MINLVIIIKIILCIFFYQIFELNLLYDINIILILLRIYLYYFNFITTRNFKICKKLI